MPASHRKLGQATGPRDPLQDKGLDDESMLLVVSLLNINCLCIGPKKNYAHLAHDFMFLLLVE